MIKILEIVSNDKEVSHFLRHIQWNFLEKLKKDKAVKKLNKLIIEISFADISEKFIVNHIRGNQDTICVMDVLLDHAVKRNELPLISCQIIETLYSINGWDKTIVNQLKENVRAGQYIVQQSVLKKSFDANLKFEIALMIKEEFIDYFVIVTDKKTKERSTFTFFEADLNPFSIKFLLNKIDLVDQKIVISDLREEIKITLDIYALESHVSFQPKDHSIEFLQRFYESFKYSYPHDDANELFVKYVNV